MPQRRAARGGAGEKHYVNFRFSFSHKARDSVDFTRKAGNSC